MVLQTKSWSNFAWMPLKHVRWNSKVNLPSICYLHLWHVSVLLSFLRQNKYLYSTCRSICISELLAVERMTSLLHSYRWHSPFSSTHSRPFARVKIFCARTRVYVCVPYIYIILYINPGSGSFEESPFSYHFRIETKKCHNNINQNNWYPSREAKPGCPEYEIALVTQKNMTYQQTNDSKNMTINLLKPTGYVTHHQFNIQQLYTLPTLYLCVLYLSENKQRLVPLTA